MSTAGWVECLVSWLYGILAEYSSRTKKRKFDVVDEVSQDGRRVAPCHGHASANRATRL